jgi:hypothetical protein
VVRLNPREQPPAFDYVAVVGGGRLDQGSGSPWSVSLGERAAAAAERLLGPAPVLQIVDLGPDPQASARTERTKHRPCPGLRSMLRLTAVHKTGATASSACFTVHRRLAGCLQAGDRLQISRGSGGGAAVSIIRADRLVVAVGALAGQPILGPDVSVRIPWDLLSEASAVFERRDPHFRFHALRALPVEISAGEAVRLTQGGSGNVGPYAFAFLRCPELDSSVGTASDECMAIFREGTWPEGDFLVSQELMGGMGPIETVAWDAP